MSNNRKTIHSEPRQSVQLKSCHLMRKTKIDIIIRDSYKSKGSPIKQEQGLYIPSTQSSAVDINYAQYGNHSPPPDSYFAQRMRRKSQKQLDFTTASSPHMKSPDTIKKRKSSIKKFKENLSRSF